LTLTVVSRLWNSLPVGQWSSDIGYEQFKLLSKTYLFGH